MTAQPGERAHLGDRLSDYVDRVLPDEQLWVCDRHVLTCPGCGEAVLAERRLLESLRRLDGVPRQGSGLQQALLQLGAQAAAVESSPPERLAVLSCGAPAMHRSARRSVALAGAAAAVCAVAAWAVAGAQPVTAGSTTPPAAERSSGAVVHPVDLVLSVSGWRPTPTTSAVLRTGAPGGP